MVRPLRLIADDLTGAADAGVTLLAAGIEVLLALDVDARAWAAPSAAVVAADTATRDGSSAEAAAAVAALVSRAPLGAQVVKKVDSALRGHVAAEVVALQAALPGRVVVVAPAFPANGRTTVGGVQHVHGVPLHLGEHWALEVAAAPRSLGELFVGLAVAEVALSVVRGPKDGLVRALAAARARGRVVVCDAEADDDLDRIVAAGAAVGEGEVVWVGSAGLAAALGRARRAAVAAAAPRAPDVVPGAVPAVAERAGRYLAVVGSAAAASRRQAAALVRAGAHLVELPAEALAAAGELLADMPATAGELPAEAFAAAAGELGAAVLAALASGDTVVTITGPVHPHQAAHVAAALATAVAPGARHAGALLLTGGATARAVLDACGVDSLALVAEVSPGIVLARPVGHLPIPVVTKSGAFGDEQALVHAVEQITPRISLQEGSSHVS